MAERKVFERARPQPEMERKDADAVHVVFYRADRDAPVPRQLRIVVLGEDMPVENKKFEKDLMELIDSKLEAAGFTKRTIPEPGDEEPAEEE